MISASYENLREYEEDYKLIPVSKEIYADSITPITLLRKLAVDNSQYYLLESVENGETWGRYSFLGYNPSLHLTCKDKVVSIKSDGRKEVVLKEPIEALRDLLEQYKSPSIKGMPPFTGGFVGYFSYGLIAYTEAKLKLKSSQFNDYDLMMFDKVIVFDHLKQKIIVIANYESSGGELAYQNALYEVDKIIYSIQRDAPLHHEEHVGVPKFTCNLSYKEYCEIVEKAKKYIADGEILQAVLSRRYEAEYKNSLLNTYRVLRTSNPSPYMYYFRNDDVEIAGSSPETLVKLIDGKLTTFPVAGTRPRGRTEEEDKALEEELLHDKKELAEHDMLVDLAIDDLGGIGKSGSVKVEEYMKIHRFSKVMHIASTVTGYIRDDKDACDTVMALLPAGTLSGAPRVRACEIIEELEPTPRGIYGGAIGYIDFAGNVDVCIAIRTAIKKGNRVYVQAGGGIVADSVADREYQESENKASAVIEAMMGAGDRRLV